MVGKRSRIGAHHHQLAMGEIDDIHHPQDDNQPECRQQQEGAVGRELVEDADNGRETVH